jgi:hypothetical protein
LALIDAVLEAGAARADADQAGHGLRRGRAPAATMPMIDLDLDLVLRSGQTPSGAALGRDAWVKPRREKRRAPEAIGPGDQAANRAEDSSDF